MAAWALAVLIFAAALAVTGHLAERVLVLTGRSSRWVWIALMGASIGWPLAQANWRSPVAVSSVDGAFTGWSGDAHSFAIIATSTWADRLAAVPDALVFGIWSASSGLLIIILLISAQTLKEDGRRWRAMTVAGERVFLSYTMGPAVVGTVWGSIVLPKWILDMDSRSQRLVVLHEREHMRCGDHHLLTFGLCLIVCVPWCLPLWWQFHRLRSAIEIDCDARILKSGAQPQEYAHLLLAVAQRQRTGRFPSPTLAWPEGVLARRIRLITSPRRMRRELAAVLLFSAGSVSFAAAYIPVPQPSSSIGGAPVGRTVGEEFDTVPMLPGGSLRGDPGQERVAEEIMRHHAATAANLPQGSIIWFLVDHAGAVRRTGIERGPERKVELRMRATYPAETSRHTFAWSDVPVGNSRATVLWMLGPRR